MPGHRIHSDIELAGTQVTPETTVDFGAINLKVDDLTVDETLTATGAIVAASTIEATSHIYTHDTLYALGIEPWSGTVVTVATGATLHCEDADGFTSGSPATPLGQERVLCLDLWSHASLKTRNLFYAQTVGWTVTGIVYEPDIAEGTGSVVCTVCKVTGNNVAVAATTPMCTAFAVTGTAGTPVVATLTATAADLVLAATNKIGCIFSGGDEFLDTGRGRLYIKMKRS